MSESLDDWFIREILPHEAALLRYLGRICPNPDDIHDIRHDAYVRILEAKERLNSVAPKSMLFKIARNLIIDRARRNRVVPIDLREDLDDLNVLVDEVTPERRASIRQQLIAASAAFNHLPTKCREVVWLRRVEEMSQKEIARRLGISEGTVEKHLMRGARLLPDLLSQPESSAAQQNALGDANHGTRYGK